MKIQESFKNGLVSTKEFFQKPQVQKALKITAVALATLAVLAAVVCVGLFISAPVMILAVPTVIAGVAGAILIGRKRSNGAAEELRNDPELMARVEEARSKLAESRQAVDDSKKRIQSDFQIRYTALADVVLKAKDNLIQKLTESPESADSEASKMGFQLKSMGNFIQLSKDLGKDVDFASLQTHQELLGALLQMNEAVEKALASFNDFCPGTLTSLQNDIEDFLNDYCK